MAHEPKLTAYTIQLKPIRQNVVNTNRSLFKSKLGESTNNNLEDSYIFTEIFRLFITNLDTQEMYSDDKSKKCMTANQSDIEDPEVSPNINLHSLHFVIEGRVEGGSYGRKRNKTSTQNKSIKSNVEENDAITEDFYFFLYCPLSSDKSTLFIQSYTDDSIDMVMKKFWQNFFTSSGSFYMPAIKRFVPVSIVEDFKTNATVSGLSFSTEVPGETLLESTRTRTTRNYKVTIKVTPTDSDLSLEEFEQTIEPLQQTFFTRLMNLGQFSKKKGTLRDNITKTISPFDLGSSFEIQPSILLSKYITINGDDGDFERIKQYCFRLLEDVRSEIYLQDAIQER